MKQYMKQTGRTASGRSAIVAVGMGLLTLAPLTILGFAPARALAGGWQEPATPQAGTSAPDTAKDANSDATLYNYGLVLKALDRPLAPAPIAPIGPRKPGPEMP